MATGQNAPTLTVTNGNANADLGKEVEVITPLAYVLEIEDGKPTTIRTFDSATELSKYMQSSGDSTSSKIYIVQGVPEDYIAVCIEHLALDRDFADAHRRRQAYDLPYGSPAFQAVESVAQFTYPEVVQWRTDPAPLSDEQQLRVPGVEPTASHRPLHSLTMTKPVRVPLGEFHIGDDRYGEEIVISQVSVWVPLRASEKMLLLIEDPASREPDRDCVLSSNDKHPKTLLNKILHEYSSILDGHENKTLELLGEDVIKRWETAAEKAVYYTRTLLNGYLQRRDDLGRDFLTRRVAYGSLQLALRDTAISISRGGEPGNPRWLDHVYKDHTAVPSILKAVDEKLEFCRKLLNESRPSLDQYSLSRMDDITALATPIMGPDVELTRSIDRLVYIGSIFVSLTFATAILAITRAFTTATTIVGLVWVVMVPVMLVVSGIIAADKIRTKSVVEYLLSQRLDDRERRQYEAMRRAEFTVLDTGKGEVREMGWLWSCATLLGYRPRVSDAVIDRGGMVGADHRASPS